MQFALISDVHSGFSTKTHIHHDSLLKQLSEDSRWDILLIAGDIATNKTEQMKKFFKRLRRYIPTKPVVVVRGNHDYWHVKYDRGFPEGRPNRDIEVIIHLHQQYFERFNIHHLEHKPYIIEDQKIVILGWDGWYTLPPHLRGNKDLQKIYHTTGDIPTELWLVRKATKDEQWVAEQVDHYFKLGYKIVLMNHMPIIDIGGCPKQCTAIPGLWAHVREKIAAYCYGHVHSGMASHYQGTLIYSAPVDYDNPGYLVFGVNHEESPTSTS